jgi:hypothetical protein
MLRKERLKRQRAETASFPAFSPFARVDAVRTAPRDDKTITIGDRMYRALDTGGSIKLVPYDPLYTPADRAAQKEGVVRALFMAGHPIGAMAYGGATLAGAPQETRDAVLVAGGLVDGMGAGGRAPIRTPRLQAPGPQVKVPRTPKVRFRPLTPSGQPTGVTASITPDMLRTGSKARRRIAPPDFVAGDSRGHLYGNELGGTGADRRNLITITQTPTNSPQMSSFEGAVARRVRAGEAIEYSSTPLYGPRSLAPSGILLTATGPREPPRALYIQNPAGRRR